MQARNFLRAVAALAAALLTACGGGTRPETTMWPQVGAAAPQLTASGFLGEFASNGSLACVMFPSACQPSVLVGGTAATGGPLAGVTVLLKDAANRTSSATTDTSGAFRIDATGLAPPFVLQTKTPAGATLYGVSSDAAGTATTNVTPLSDLVVRSWYFLQGRATDAAFADLTAAPAPSPAQASATAQAILPALQLGITVSKAPIAQGTDLLSQPFVANHTGVDALLDNLQTQASNIKITLTISVGAGVTQSSTVTYDTSASAVTVNTSTQSASAVTTTSYTAAVPGTSAATTALNEINAGLAAFANVVNSRGTSLTVADLTPFAADDYLNDGLNKTQDFAQFVNGLSQGQAVTLAVDRILSLDTTTGNARVTLKFTQTLGGQTQTDYTDFYFRKVNGTWLIGGDRLIARFSVQAEARVNQGAYSSGSGPSVNVDIRPPQGTVSNVSLSGGLVLPAVTRGATEVLPGNVFLDAFYSNTGPLTGTLPQAGTPVTVTLAKSAGGSVAYTIPLNAFTTDPIRITNLTATTASPGALNVAWKLPTTYAIRKLQLSAISFTGPPNTGFQCIGDDTILSPDATSGQVTILATCNGLPVTNANINLSATGFNGERSQAIYFMNVR